MKNKIATTIFAFRATCLVLVALLAVVAAQAEVVTVKAYLNGNTEATELTGEVRQGPNSKQYFVVKDASESPRAYLIDKIEDSNVADVNGDKAVTIADVTALVNIILGKTETRGDVDMEDGMTGSQVGDVNGDGMVTIADVTALVNIILGKTEYQAETFYYLTSLPIVGFDENGDVIIGWGGSADDNPDDFDPSAKEGHLW